MNHEWTRMENRMKSKAAEWTRCCHFEQFVCIRGYREQLKRDHELTRMKDGVRSIGGRETGLGEFG